MINDKKLEMNNPKFINNMKVYQPIPNYENSENINVIGFVRPPISEIYQIKNSFVENPNLNIREVYENAIDNSLIKVIEINDNILNKKIENNIFFLNMKTILLFICLLMTAKLKKRDQKLHIFN